MSIAEEAGTFPGRYAEAPTARLTDRDEWPPLSLAAPSAAPREDTSTLGNLRQLVDWENGRVTPAIHFDEEIYRIEAERVFGRAWLVVGHEDMVRKPGDYVTNYMGEVPVVIARDATGEIRV